MSSRTEGVAAPQRGFDPERVRRAQRRSGVSKLLAYGAAAGAVALAGVYAIQLGLFDGVTGPADTAPPVPVTSPDLMTGKNATIAGTGKNNQPFEVQAKSGIQDRDQETLVHLQAVDGMFQRPNGEPLKVDAARARYDTVSKMLQLEGEVTFDEKGRFTAKMDGAEVNTETQTLVSKSPVTVNVSGGTIKADSFTVTDQGQRMLFKGGVKARFMTEGRPTGDGE
ncbi:MAG: LPS export ABC transporter periplasmic protein LptC [Proteobacteria bacterium]|nr:LPS export ABC transporter periplasmic protein LptC [Pseudomonadota bacterium]